MFTDYGISGADPVKKATWLFVQPSFRLGFDAGGLDAVFVKPGAEYEETINKAKGMLKAIEIAERQL